MILAFLTLSESGDIILALNYGGTIAEWHLMDIVADDLPEPLTAKSLMVVVAEPTPDDLWKISPIGVVDIQHSLIDFITTDCTGVDYLAIMADCIANGDTKIGEHYDTFITTILGHLFDGPGDIDRVATTFMPGTIAATIIAQHRARYGRAIPESHGGYS